MIFSPTRLSDAEEQLRSEVRGFLAERLPADHTPGLGLGGAWDRDFSRDLAERGWVGMAIPEVYGGHGRTPVERFLVAEELLAAGAPTLGHWTADRQTAPTLMAFGTEEQRRRFLPAIVTGTCWFAIGMSEPDAGSDLAAVRTWATKVDSGWLLNGTKVWTSGAHLADYMVVLCRTASDTTDRHQGLSQLIVATNTPGIKISSIRLLQGEPHFNEVVFEDAFVPDDLVLGNVGEGWHQVTSELAYERSGPDRYLSAFGVLKHFVAECGAGLDAIQLSAVGLASAQLWTIRQLSLAVARSLERGAAPAVEAAMVKDLGTVYEQGVVQLLQHAFDLDLDAGSASMFARLLSEAVLTGPAFTLRGGTTEILRSIVSKALTR
jgi:alkylation response protein AidB-like acyl-CoA dehydrogenase